MPSHLTQPTAAEQAARIKALPVRLGTATMLAEEASDPRNSAEVAQVAVHTAIQHWLELSHYWTPGCDRGLMHSPSRMQGPHRTHVADEAAHAYLDVLLGWLPRERIQRNAAQILLEGKILEAFIDAEWIGVIPATKVVEQLDILQHLIDYTRATTQDRILHGTPEDLTYTALLNLWGKFYFRRILGFGAKLLFDPVDRNDLLLSALPAVAARTHPILDEIGEWVATPNHKERDKLLKVAARFGFELTHAAIYQRFWTMVGVTARSCHLGARDLDEYMVDPYGWVLERGLPRTDNQLMSAYQIAAKRHCARVGIKDWQAAIYTYDWSQDELLAIPHDLRDRARRQLAQMQS